MTKQESTVSGLIEKNFKWVSFSHKQTSLKKEMGGGRTEFVNVDEDGKCNNMEIEEYLELITHYYL